MRPHVELIHEDDLIWHPAELPHGHGEAVQRNLSVNEEDGSASTRVDFLSEFSRPSGRHVADTEWYVIEGRVEVGDYRLGKGWYFRAPKGCAVPGVRARAGTRILLFREDGDWDFKVTNQSGPELADDLIVVNTDEKPWEGGTIANVSDRAAGESNLPSGLFIKILYRNRDTGFVTSLGWAKPGFSDERYYHHPVYEEAYNLSGSGLTYNFGIMAPGTYFFRPPWVKHGLFNANEPDGLVWLGRSDGDLVHYCTRNPTVIVKGTAQNYDPETEGPIIAGLPVRSRSAGKWDGAGR